MVQGAKLVCETVNKIAEGNCPTLPQNKEITFAEAPKIYKETCKINWHKNGLAIEQLIRGMSPYPTAWTEFIHKGETLPTKVYDALFQPHTHQLPIGTIIADKKHLQIAVTDGYIQLLELQLPAKKRMKTTDLLNGFSFNETTIAI